MTDSASDIQPNFQTANNAWEAFSYDGVNRLHSMTDDGGGTNERDFAYDQFGNMWVSNNTGFNASGTMPVANVYNGANRLNNTNYDAAGNQLNVNGSSISYDAEGKVAQVGEPTSVGGATMTYYYDGEGHRVEKVVNNVASTVYVYDAQGQLAAEYAASATAAALCQTCYLSTDHLGSTRMVTDSSGHVVARHDYLPFGEEIVGAAGRTALWGTSDAINQKFTGKEHDSESGLDYFGARYYGSSLGRFTSPDPHSGSLLHIINPQRWNMCSYAINNPLSFVDPDGKDAMTVDFANLAMGLGHAAIVSVHKDGTAEYGDYGPSTPGSPVDAGKYNVFGLKTKIEFDSKGVPTKESFEKVTKELAADEHQPEGSITLAYYKTSDSETAALDAFLKNLADLQAKGKAPEYYVGFRDCINVCARGLQAAGVGSGPSVLSIPNFSLGLLGAFSDATYYGQTKQETHPKEVVKSDWQPCSSTDSSGRCIQ